MKPVTINRSKPASTVAPVQELTPKHDLPAERYTHKIILNVFGKRFELTRHAEVRVLSKGPAKVIEMPGRSAIRP